MKITLNHTTIELLSGIKLDTYKNSQSGFEWWNDIIDFLEQWADTNTKVTLKTSGSTGEPKVFEAEKSKMWISAMKTCDYFGLNEKSTGLLCLPVQYIAGKMMLVRAMVSGMKLVCYAPSNNPVEKLNQPIDFAAMVPLQALQSLDTPVNFNLIKHLIIGGATVPNMLVNQLKKHQVNVYETFGMTETLSHIAVKKIAPETTQFFIPFNDVFILQGANNVMVIDYPEMGIYKMKTHDIIDIVDNSGSFIWKGRTDFVINSGGVKISPEEIEYKIGSLLMQNYCIIGVPDEILGEKIVLVIEGKPFDTKALMDDLKKLLPKYWCPKTVLFIPTLPTTTTQKIDRKKLIALFNR